VEKIFKFLGRLCRRA